MTKLRKKQLTIPQADPLRRSCLAAGLLLTVSAFGFGCTAHKTVSPLATIPAGDSPNGAAADGSSYYTCTMHPQIHLPAPGKCPICGMPLVLVQAAKKAEADTVDVSEQQKQNLQMAHETVQRRDLILSTPVFGRVISPKEIAFQIYESDLQTIKVGLEFSGSSTAFPDRSLKGRITRVDRLIDPTSRTARATGTLTGSESALTTETGFQAEIQQVLKNQIVISEEAVLHSGTKDVVYVLSKSSTEGSQFQARKVQLGAKGQNQFQVLSGLKEGDVISSGPNFLMDSEAKLHGL